jgi:hypothetical protein
MKALWKVLKIAASIVLGWFIWFWIGNFGPHVACFGSGGTNWISYFPVGLPFPSSCVDIFSDHIKTWANLLFWILVSYLIIYLLIKLIKKISHKNKSNVNPVTNSVMKK